MKKIRHSLQNVIDTLMRLARNLKRAYIDLWRFSPRFVLLYGLVSVTNVVGSVGAAYLFGKSIDMLIRAVAGESSARPALLFVLGSMLLGLVEQLSFQIANIIERRTFLRYQGHLELVVNTKLSSLDMERHEDQDTNALITRVVNDASWKPGNFAFKIFTFMQALARLIAPGIVLVAFAPWMLPVLILASLPSLITEFRLSKIHWGFWQQDGDVNTLHWRLVGQLRSKESLKEVKLYGLVGYLSRQISSLTEMIANKQDAAIKRFTGVTILARVAETSAVLGLTLWLLGEILAVPARLTIGNFTFYSGMLTRFSNAVGLVANVVSEMLTYNLYMTDYYQLMDMPKLLPEPEHPVVLGKDTIPTIVFDNVSFGYPGAKKPALRSFSLAIHPGERLALVGENGAGKTTIIKLLMRFYDVDEGRILIDGHDIRELDLNSWYRHIGVLFQDFNRYPFDVQENIQIGRIGKNSHHTSFADAVAMADLTDGIATLPYKEKTILDSSFTKGVEPSGGQWQRVALARAFYRDANVLILDEPTAAVDARAEYAIFNNIFKHYINRTGIIISHRFSTVRKADRIVVLEHGTIVEEGTHHELLHKGGLYADMFEKQAEGYR